MAEPSTIARPYAEAVFKLAEASGKLAAWSTMLGLLAQLTEDERVRGALLDPNLSSTKTSGLLIGIVGEQLDAEARNFVRVLADNHRLELLQEIRLQFESLRNEREGTVEAEIGTAFELTPAQLKDLVSRLEKHTGRKVKAHVVVDKDLIGGVRVFIGDKVIDASARAQLAALENTLHG